MTSLFSPSSKLPLSVRAYLKDFKHVKVYYEKLIEEFNVTLKMQTEARNDDVSTLEQKLFDSSEVETFTKDLYNMMDGIESEVAEKAKKDHMEKIRVLNLEIKDIEMNDLRIRNELTGEKQRVQELELQLREEYLKMKKALEIKKKSNQSCILVSYIYIKLMIHIHIYI